MIQVSGIRDRIAGALKSAESLLSRPGGHLRLGSHGNERRTQKETADRTVILAEPGHPPVTAQATRLLGGSLPRSTVAALRQGPGPVLGRSECRRGGLGPEISRWLSRGYMRAGGRRGKRRRRKGCDPSRRDEMKLHE
eukprot:482867-Hanusia_phi.AAC.1